MTRLFFIAVIITSMLYSCKEKNSKSSQIETTALQQATTVKFFPVTEFLKGEIYEIKSNYKVPLKKFTTNGKTDSLWLKMEDLEKEFADFLQPVIDSASLASRFSESSFNDQTLNAITLTYEPRPGMTDSSILQKWDVYINPNTGKVKRIYIVKNLAEGREQQLTWQSGEYAKISVLKFNGNKTDLEKEVIYTWDY